MMNNHEEYNLRYLVVLLDSITSSASLPGHKLSLKKRYLVMLSRNLQPSIAHVNGETYIVKSLKGNVLFLCIATGNHEGKRMTTPSLQGGSEDDDVPTAGFWHFPI